MPHLARPAALVLVLCGLLGLGACSTAGLVMTAAGIATDTSVTWEVVKHIHGKLTEDDPTPCLLLNSVQRALNPRCDFAPGSIRAADLARSGLQDCPLAAATRDPRLWRALPELLEKGARSEQCDASPLIGLAAADPCPDFGAAAPETLAAFARLAESDRRAVHHDVFRMLGCPRARAAGLDRLLLGWLDRGWLEPGTLSFSPLDAADPDLLVARLGRELEVAGHTPEAALGSYEGVLPSGFELALRESHWAALEWWLYRLPELANRAPPAGGDALAWLPLQRVVVPGYLRHPETQRDMVVFLLARGADPQRKLPFDPGKTVLAFATSISSPVAAMLEPAPAPAALGGATRVAGDVVGAPARRTHRADPPSPPTPAH